MAAFGQSYGWGATDGGGGGTSHTPLQNRVRTDDVPLVYPERLRGLRLLEIRDSIYFDSVEVLMSDGRCYRVTKAQFENSEFAPRSVNDDNFRARVMGDWMTQAQPTIQAEAATMPTPKKRDTLRKVYFKKRLHKK